MCGRYQLADQDNDEVEEIIRQVQRSIDGGAAIKTGEIYPSNVVPVYQKEGLKALSWGFPKWNGKGLIINARSETASEKSMFSKALRARRCVIPSTGFFEWSRVSGKTKGKYIFNVPGRRMLYMAGVANGESFVILTRAANQYMAIHDRMPVILEADEMGAWLRDDQFISKLFGRGGAVLEMKLSS